MDQTLQPQPSQVVGHLGRAIGAPKQGFDAGAQVAIAEAAREMGEAGDRLEECHDAWIAEAQRRGALSAFHGGPLEPVEGVLVRTH